MDKKMEIHSFTTTQLLQLHSQILEELQKRGIVKTKNNPIGDYAEWIVSKCLGCSLTSNSNSGYDAIDDQGIRYQIKARRITPSNKSSQLSAIRGLEKNDFDYLVAILFDQGYALTKALKIPHSVIGKYSKYRKHVNAHILYIRGPLLEDVSVEDITNLLSSEHAKPTLITD
jgi:hypothetical protein